MDYGKYGGSNFGTPKTTNYGGMQGLTLRDLGQGFDPNFGVDPSLLKANPIAQEGGWADKFGGMEGIGAGIQGLSSAIGAGTGIYNAIQGRKQFKDMMGLRLAGAEQSRNAALWNMQRQMDKDKRMGRGVSPEMQANYDKFESQKLG